MPMKENRTAVRSETRFAKQCGLNTGGIDVVVVDVTFDIVAVIELNVGQADVNRERKNMAE